MFDDIVKDDKPEELELDLGLEEDNEEEEYVICDKCDSILTEGEECDCDECGSGCGCVGVGC